MKVLNESREETSLKKSTPTGKIQIRENQAARFVNVCSTNQSNYAQEKSMLGLIKSYP